MEITAYTGRTTFKINLEYTNNNNGTVTINKIQGYKPSDSYGDTLSGTGTQKWLHVKSDPNGGDITTLDMGGQSVVIYGNGAYKQWKKQVNGSANENLDWTFDCLGSQNLYLSVTGTTVNNILNTKFILPLEGGYPAPSEVTLTNVTTDIGTASVSVYIKGAYTEVQYSKDGSSWQSSNTFNNLIHNQRYVFYARARNNTSSWVTSGGYSATIPGYAPIIETITPTVGDTTCTFPTSGSGITYDNAQYKRSTLKYRVEGTSNWTTLTTTASPVILSGLDIVTTYEYEYTITDSSNKISNTVTGTFTTTGQSKARIKVNGTWKKGRIFFKKNGEWVVTKKIFYKKDGSWVATKNS